MPCESGYVAAMRELFAILRWYQMALLHVAENPAWRRDSMKITEKQKRELIHDGVSGGMTRRGEQFLFIDNHGFNVTLVAVEKAGHDGLLGFTYLESSEISIYDEGMELVPLREATKVVFERADGKKWST